MRQIIQHFTDDDLYKFTMCCAVIDIFPRTQVKYRFNDRNATVYPPGFAEELRRQIVEEFPFVPAWFYSYLKGFRYDSRQVTVRQDEAGHLDITFEGCWSDTILLEVKVLAIVSELYYMMTGRAESLD